MRPRRHLALACAILILLTGTACAKSLDEAVADLNARATQVASGGSVDLGGVIPTRGPTSTPGPAVVINLTLNPDASLAGAWDQIYELSPGTEFTVTASQQQVATYVIRGLQDMGWADNVRGGSVTLGAGQIRLDLAIVDPQGGFDAATATFQPTLDASARVQLNSQGVDMRSLAMPDTFTGALNEAVLSALTGSRTNLFSPVRLSRLSLENGQMSVSGTVR